MRRWTILLLLAVLLYLGLRGFILYSNFDQVCITQYELHPMGNMAKDLLEGSGYPLIGFCDTHSGGELVTGFLALPFYFILGDHYLSLKLVPLTLGLGLLILIYFFLKSNFGQAAAALGGILFALGPTLLVSHSMTAMGNHFEILFFVMLVFLVFYRFHWGASGRFTLLWLGLFSGWAVFHNFSSILPLGILGICHLGFRGWKETAKDLILLVPGFVVGIFPLLLINLGTTGGGLTFLEAKFMKESAFSLSMLLERVVNFFMQLPTSSCYPGAGSLPPELPRYLFLACFAGVYLFSIPLLFKGLSGLFRGFKGRGGMTRAEGHARLLPFLLYLPCFALAYVLGDFKLGGYVIQYEIGANRYFLTHSLVAVLLIAITIPELVSKQRSVLVRGAGILLVGIPLLCGLLNFTLGDILFRRAGLGPHYNGFYYAKFSRGLLGPTLGDGPEAIEAHLARFRPRHRHRVYSGIGYLRGMVSLRPSMENRAQFRRTFGTPPPDKIMIHNLNLPELLSGFPDKFHIDLARGVGARLRDYLEDEELLSGGLKKEILEQIKKHPHPAWSYLIEGLSQSQEFVLEKESSGFMAVSVVLFRKDPVIEPAPYMLRGQGLFSGRLLCRLLESEREAVVKLLELPIGSKKDFLFGLGWGLADGGEEPAYSFLLDEMLTGPKREWVCLGFGACFRHLYGAQEGLARLKDLPDTISDRCRKKFSEGARWPDYPKALTF